MNRKKIIIGLIIVFVGLFISFPFLFVATRIRDEFRREDQAGE